MLPGGEQSLVNTVSSIKLKEMICTSVPLANAMTVKFIGSSNAFCAKILSVIIYPMNIAQAKCIPIDQYLARQGHNPKHSKHAGRELWYHSPIRSGDENPSFKVDTIKNLWYDHGLATGGTIITLVCEMCSCDVRDALQHLDRSGLYSPALSRPQMGAPSQNANSGTTRRASRGENGVSGKKVVVGEKEKRGPLELIKSGALKHPALLQYLTKRKIDHTIASQYVSQIDFKGPQGRGTYFGVGFPFWKWL